MAATTPSGGQSTTTWHARPSHHSMCARPAGLRDGLPRVRVDSLSSELIFVCACRLGCGATKRRDRRTGFSGGGNFGPQYAYSHRHSDTFKGQYPYTEFLELAVDVPVYIFNIVVGYSRGAGAVVGIGQETRAPRPDLRTSGSACTRGRPLNQMFQEQLASGGPFVKWEPRLCRLPFKTDTIRLEIDTVSLLTSANSNEWHYIDYVQVFGAESLQESALQGGSFSRDGVYGRKTYRVLYVPFENANGYDSFEYTSNDCAGNIFRTSEAGVVSFSIMPVNDVPHRLIPTFTLTTRTTTSITVGQIVGDVETRAEDLVFSVTQCVSHRPHTVGLPRRAASALPQSS